MCVFPQAREAPSIESRNGDSNALRLVVREKKTNLKSSKVTFFIWSKCQFRTF
jgi:hypothetical protein